MASYHLHCLLFVSLTLCSSIHCVNLDQDRSAVLRLHAALRGQTIRWNITNTSPCSWDGITCDANISRVVAVRLPGDGLVGELPIDTLGNLTELRVLSLRNNAISGAIPADLGLCLKLNQLHLSGNRFSGEIPGSLFKLTDLTRVNLAGNRFSGNLSSGFNNLVNLTTLFLENNYFSGQLPDLPSLNNLKGFNVSFTGLTGPIPTSLQRFLGSSFIGTSLCGGPLVACRPVDNDSDDLSGGAIAGIVIGSVVGLLLILVILFFVRRKSKTLKTSSLSETSFVRPTKPESWNRKPIVVIEEGIVSKSNGDVSSKNQNGRLKMIMNDDPNDGLVLFGDDVKAFTLSELLTSSAEVFGKGTVGSTYKAYLQSGVEVVVKRLRTVTLPQREFRMKMEEVGTMAHQNLWPLKGYFFGKEEKLLVFSPAPNGSLHSLLHGNTKQPLSWEMRSKIALSAARGIEHIHSISTGTTHGNIKSSNIFLGPNYNSLVSEFGLTQLVSPMSNMSGYRAPEVFDSRKISQAADVYSFGILLLELLTSKSPDNALQQGIVLPNWVQSVQEKQTIDVFDHQLLEYEYLAEKLVQLLHLAISCTSQQPEKRPSMTEISRRIGELCESSAAN